MGIPRASRVRYCQRFSYICSRGQGRRENVMCPSISRQSVALFRSRKSVPAVMGTSFAEPPDRFAPLNENDLLLLEIIRFPVSRGVRRGSHSRICSPACGGGSGGGGGVWGSWRSKIQGHKDRARKSIAPIRSDLRPPVHLLVNHAPRRFNFLIGRSRPQQPGEPRPQPK